MAIYWTEDDMSKCPACGQFVDGSVCDDRCADEMDRRKTWAGKEPCEKCMELEDQCDWEPATVGDLCERHEEARNEAAYERSLEDFYGSSTPQTMRESQ